MTNNHYCVAYCPTHNWWTARLSCLVFDNQLHFVVRYDKTLNKIRLKSWFFFLARRYHKQAALEYRRNNNCSPSGNLAKFVAKPNSQCPTFPIASSMNSNTVSHIRFFLNNITIHCSCLYSANRPRLGLGYIDCRNRKWLLYTTESFNFLVRQYPLNIMSCVY